jgi:transposase
VFTERTSVGLDVHARSVVAAGIDGVTGEVFRARLTPGNDVVVGWVRALPGPSAVVLRGGSDRVRPIRAFTTAGIRCEIVAPSKIQRPAGDRVKTDARDAMHLARLLRLDEIVSVDVPTVQREAARDLVRAREDVCGDLMRARHRVSNLLLRQGIVYYGGQAWTGTHLVWLRRQHFDAPGLQLAFDADHEAVLQAEARRNHLDKAITAMPTGSEYTPVVHRLGCLRGVSTLTAFELPVEVGDWDRLTGASIGAYLGLVPTESSSGQASSQGSITKTGNTDARRLLVEAAWHHLKPYCTPGATMKARWELAPRPPEPATRRQPATAPAVAGLHRPQEETGHRQRRDRRELAGWCWSLAVMDD